MQGLADGYFVIPYTIADYLARATLPAIDPKHAAFADVEGDAKRRVEKLVSAKRSNGRSPDHFHRQLGRLMIDECGMSRSAEGLRRALQEIPKIREAFWQEVNVTGSGGQLNQALERAGRLADFLEFAELMCVDALAREESCGGHFREEHQSAEGEAKRDDAGFCHVSAWGFKGVGEPPEEHREPLTFEHVKLTTRSYK
jgi:succinate dehydrogenase / fumarate reductase flavoprotein subunit